VPVWKENRNVPFRPPHAFLSLLAVPIRRLSLPEGFRRDEFLKIIRESFFALFICGLTDLVAGFYLSSMDRAFELLPGLLILVPGSIAMRGNIFASMGSRLSTAIHIGEIELDVRMWSSDVVRNNVLSAFAQTLFSGSVLGVFASIAAFLWGMNVVPWYSFVAVGVLAGLISGVFLLLFSVWVAIGGFRRGWDPDNISAPLITSVGDLVTLPAMVLAVFVVMSLSGGVLLSIAISSIAAAIGLVLYSRHSFHTWNIIKESLPILTLCAVFSTTSGSFLERYMAVFAVYPALLIFVPPLNEEAGNLGSILASRLSSGVRLGTIKMGFVPDDVSFMSMLAVLLQVALVFPLVAVAAHTFSIFMGVPAPSLGDMVAMSLFAGAIIGVVSGVLAYYFTFASVRCGLDPDNVVIPVITSVMDVVGTLSLVMAIHIFL